MSDSTTPTVEPSPAPQVEQKEVPQPSPQPPVSTSPPMVDTIIKKIEFIPIPSQPSPSIMDYLHHPLVKLSLLLLMLSVLLAILVRILHRTHEEPEPQPIPRPPPEVKILRPEIHYDISITPELIKKLVDTEPAPSD